MQAFKQWIKKNFSSWVFRQQRDPARKSDMENWLRQVKTNPPAQLSDASFDVFTYHGEDGILFYLLDQLGNVPTTFIDMGAGDCIKSNCANLAVHFNWNGVFIDQDKHQLSVGKRFYRKITEAGAPIDFIEAAITSANVNELLKQHQDKKIGLLSIDIDGNDFWIWKAIELIQPEIVLIEAKVEFGFQSIVVPDSPDNHHSVDSMYNGASVEAFRKLGAAKGYKLVGANKQGYNLFFVKEEYLHVPAAAITMILGDPKTVDSFYPGSFFKKHVFENI